MEAAAFFALISNTSPSYLAGVIETLMFECVNGRLSKPVLINMDTTTVFRFRPGKYNREDPVARYGGLLGNIAVPLLNPSEAAGFFEDAAKGRNAALSTGRSFISLSREPPSVEVLPLYDALCFAVALDDSSTAFVYAAIKAMLSSGRRLPIRLLVVGDPRIERCAEFYVELVDEIKALSGGALEISFAGHMALDQEESDLAAGFGLPTIEVYPESAPRGQAKQAVRRLFDYDPSEADMQGAERMVRLSKYLRSIRP